MSWWVVPLVIFVAVSLLSMVMAGRDRLKARARYQALVGRDLAGLVALLPGELQDRRYTGFALAPFDQLRIGVGLIYDDGRKSAGNPPNVGIEFDPLTGNVVAIHPAGIGLGIK